MSYIKKNLGYESFVPLQGQKLENLENAKKWFGPVPEGVPNKCNKSASGHVPEGPPEDAQTMFEK